jgi:hypothetical protein
MPIIPMPIFIPDDGNSSDLIIPDAVGFILFGGVITALTGLILVMVAVVIELLFDLEIFLLVKIAAALTMVGICAILIGVVLALLTGQTVEG